MEFDFDREWIEKVEVSEIPMDKLEEEDRKPDRVGARTLAFALTYRDSENKALISVFKIAEYKEAFARFPRYVEHRDRKLKSLIKKSAVSKTWGLEQPLHVKWMDGHHDFYAKAGVVDFNGGKGLLIITQIGQDAYTVINNDGLEYLFQGFTEDGVYFVEMSFPANMEGLPSEFDSETFVQHGLPKDCCSSKYHDDFVKYKSTIAKKIDSSPDKAFQPSSASIRAFLKTFRIR